MKIRGRILLVCCAVAIPLLGMCGVNIWNDYQGRCRSAQTTVTSQVHLVGRSLADWVSDQQLELKALSMVPDIQEPKSEESQRILEATARIQRDWNAVFLTDKQGRILISSMEAGPSAQGELIALDFFKELLKTKKPAVSGFVNCPVSGRPALLFGVPVTKQGQLQYLLILSADPNAIAKRFNGFMENSGGVITVIDQNGTVLARTLDNGRWVGKDFRHAQSVKHAAKTNNGTFEAVGVADQIRRTYAFHRMRRTNWIVVVGIPTDLIYGSAYDRLFVMLASALLAAGVSGALAFRITGHFTAPINELVREAVAIGRGDLSKRVTVKQGGEFGLLARAFNQMAINLELNRDYKQMVEKIADSIRQSLDLDHILNTTVTELGQALSASRCCLALFGSVQQASLVGSQLEFNYVWWDPDKQGSALKNCSVLITDNSMLKLILEQKAILSLDVMDTQTFTPIFERDESSPEDWRSIKSLIACPIVFADTAIGMILVQQCDVRRAWFDLELELVEAVANHVALAMEHANLFSKTKTLAEQEFLINSIVRSIRASLDTDTILGTVTAELGKALGLDYCQIAMPRAEGPLVITHEFHAEGLPDSKGMSLYDAHLDFEPGSDSFMDLNNLLGLDLARLREFAIGGKAGEIPISAIASVASDNRGVAYREFLSKIGSRSLIAAPLLQNERLLGILLMHQCTGERDWHSGEIRLAAAIADQLAVAVSHADLFAQVKYQAITDGLTGLYNHIYFKNRLSEELRRASRKGTPCSLLMLDLDKLKLINDTMGHPIGDAAIRQVATVLKNLLRSGDTAARYGGEEFAVILPDTPLSEALLIAERLRQNIHRNPVPGLGNISTSIGAAFYPVHAESPAELVERADKALYLAKKGGRNRVCVWSDPQPIHVSPMEDLPLLSLNASNSV